MNDFYQNKLATAGEIFASLRPNQHIVTAMAAAEPTQFFLTLCQHARSLKNVTIHCANPMNAYSCFLEEGLDEHIRLNTMFLTAALRKNKLPSHVQYVPQHLSKWVRNIFENSSVDVFWGSCTPPDARGYVSLGVGCCFESEVLSNAKIVVLEVNHQMPRTYGATQVHSSRVTHFIENSHDLPLCLNEAQDGIDEKIADFVSEFVKNGSTLQLGIGSIPNALGERLKDKRELGIHTELITDCIVTLYEHGVITGSHKKIWRDKIIGSFVYGSRRLYDFVDQNPAIELQPSSLVNNPTLIAKNDRAVSINSAIEIDLTGQICSESLGHREISGAGGASETHLGAQMSAGGRGIIAMRSQTKKGTSKIVCSLTQGSKVTISRNDIDTVVTEYGVAHLRGKSVKDRVKSLIALAHPECRESLLSEAQECGYL
jgi:acyl-CoA hydrolase